MRLLRLAKILNVCRRHGIDVLILEHEPSGKLAALARLLGGGKRCTAPRGERLRLALESLGPIFVKFGQVLSTRRDLLPLDIADELAKLQDRVPSFPFDQVKTQVEAAYGKPVQEVFAEFEEPVHFYRGTIMAGIISDEVLHRPERGFAGARRRVCQPTRGVSRARCRGCQPERGSSRARR